MRRAAKRAGLTASSWLRPAAATAERATERSIFNAMQKRRRDRRRRPGREGKRTEN